jgi:hypothetical protein
MLNVLSSKSIFQGGVFQWSGVSSTSDNVSVMDRFLGTDELPSPDVLLAM